MKMDKLKQLMDDAGFLPDGDLLEFGEIVVKECIKALGPNGATSYTFAESLAWEESINKIKNHFNYKRN